jgi:hypothetical protein
MLALVSLVLSITSAVGVGGLIVLWFIAPSLFGIVVEALQKVLGAILATRIGCAILAATSAAVLSSDISHTNGVNRGIARERARWEAAEQRSVDRGEKARADAEREIPPVPAEPVASAPAAAEPAASGHGSAVLRRLHPAPARGVQHQPRDPHQRD